MTADFISGNGPNSRKVRRCPLVATAEVTDVSTGTKLSARTSEFGVGGCYVDTMNPFPEGTLVHVKISRDSGPFEAQAKIVYSQSNFGMGIAFVDLTREQRVVLENWLAELVLANKSDS